MNANKLKLPTPSQLQHKTELVAKALLPAYLMYVLGQKAGTEGMALRADYLLHMQRHMAKQSEGLDEFSLSRASNLVQERANLLLREVPSSNAVIVLYIVVYCIIKAVDEGVITDTTSQPVLYSLLLADEIQDFGAEFSVNERWCKQKAAEMFSHCYHNAFL